MPVAVYRPVTLPARGNAALANIPARPGVLKAQTQFRMN
jgi:hypothetical protein